MLSKNKSHTIEPYSRANDRAQRQCRASSWIIHVNTVYSSSNHLPEHTHTHTDMRIKNTFTSSKSFIFQNSISRPLSNVQHCELLFWFYFMLSIHPCVQCFLLTGAVEGYPEWMVIFSICSTRHPWEGLANVTTGLLSLIKKGLEYFLLIRTPSTRREKKLTQKKKIVLNIFLLYLKKPILVKECK